MNSWQGLRQGMAGGPGAGTLPPAGELLPRGALACLPSFQIFPKESENSGFYGDVPQLNSFTKQYRRER